MLAFSTLAVTTLFSIAEADGNHDETIGASIGAAGAIAAALLGIMGRRRTQGEASTSEMIQIVEDAHNEAICHRVTHRFAGHHMLPFVSTMMSSKPMTPMIAETAAEMAKYCEEHVERRRLVEGGDQDWATFVDALIEAGLEAKDEVKRHNAISPSLARRLGESGNKRVSEKLQKFVTQSGYQQCAGYAAAASYLASKTGKAKGAEVFAVNAKGSDEEKNDGCGSVVNFVNAKIEDDEGLNVEEDEEGHMIVTVAEDLASEFGKLVTAVTLASGAVAWKLMSLCNGYVDMIDLA